MRSICLNSGEIPSSLPVFLDSPMAVHTHLFESHPGEHRLSRQDSHALTHATMVNSTDESRAGQPSWPMVILSASGMNHGRVLHHGPAGHRNMIILTGYGPRHTRQDAGQRSRTVRIHGEM